MNQAPESWSSVVIVHTPTTRAKEFPRFARELTLFHRVQACSVLGVRFAPTLSPSGFASRTTVRYAGGWQ